MTARPVIRDLPAVFAGRTLLPTLTRYNRLESRPRTDNFARAMRAEVRDALWMLCKQWQMGEFVGDDAGTPVSAKVHIEGQQISMYQAGANLPQTFDLETPLECTVERRAIAFQSGGQTLALDIRLLLGRRWLKMIPASARLAFATHYAIAVPEPAAKADALICAHVETWQRIQVVATRAMDGGALYLHLRDNASNLASDGVASLSGADKAAADLAGPRFVAWFEALYTVPDATGGEAWQPERLDHQFACAVPDGTGGEKVLAADAYDQGTLDWFAFDWDRRRSGLGTVPGAATDLPVDDRYLTQSFIPAPVRFNGMPDTRWWAFEDGKTNFGDIKPGTTDLAKLLLIEFGLVYANDWFMLPYTVPTGSVLNIQGLAITNTFGERYWIEAAGRGADDNWQRWSMFTLNVDAATPQPADTTLLILPTVPKIQEGAPLEEVTFIRDEMANMVWGIETVVPMADGWSRQGSVAAAELTAHLHALLAAASTGSPLVLVPTAPLRYDVMSTVTENWIPFVPEHVPGDNRQIQLRRAAMPRNLANDPAPTFERVRPRTTLLAEGLADHRPYRIHEEEVSRAGVRVSAAYQRTRWNDGKVFTWLGISTQTGRGEGHSGLAFDRLLATGE